MNADIAIDLAREALTEALIVGAPLLVTVLVVALVVALLQTATQVQDQVLSFVPKLLAGAIVLVLVGGWMLTRLVDFGRMMFGGSTP